MIFRQANGASIYVDIYNSTLGNDIEPTSLTQCGYERPNNAYCGGWGFRQLNVLHAITYLLSNPMAESLFVVISNPVPWKPYSKSNSMFEIKWTQSGNCNNNQFTVSIDLDELNIANVSSTAESYQLETKDLSIGFHSLSIYSLDCLSALSLSYEYLSPVLSGNNMIIPRDYIEFTVGS